MKAYESALQKSKLLMRSLAVLDVFLSRCDLAFWKASLYAYVNTFPG